MIRLIIVALLVELFAADGSPYSSLGALGGLVYLGASQCRIRG